MMVIINDRWIRRTQNDMMMMIMGPVWSIPIQSVSRSVLGKKNESKYLILWFWPTSFGTKTRKKIHVHIITMMVEMQPYVETFLLRFILSIWLSTIGQWISGIYNQKKKNQIDWLTVNYNLVKFFFGFRDIVIIITALIIQITYTQKKTKLGLNFDTFSRFLFSFWLQSVYCTGGGGNQKKKKKKFSDHHHNIQQH